MRPLPDIKVQTTRALVSLEILNTLMGVLEEGDADAETARVLARVKKWLARALETLPDIPKTSASWRLSQKIHTQFRKAWLKRATLESTSAEEAYTAWTFAAWELLADAMATAKDITKCRAWHYLDKAVTQMAMSWEKQYPHGAALGHEVYMLTETA